LSPAPAAAAPAAPPQPAKAKQPAKKAAPKVDLSGRKDAAYTALSVKATDLDDQQKADRWFEILEEQKPGSSDDDKLLTAEDWDAIDKKISTLLADGTVDELPM
jgi:hypothetical protein